MTHTQAFKSGEALQVKKLYDKSRRSSACGFSYAQSTLRYLFFWHNRYQEIAVIFATHMDNVFPFIACGWCFNRKIWVRDFGMIAAQDFHGRLLAVVGPARGIIDLLAPAFLLRQRKAVQQLRRMVLKRGLVGLARFRKGGRVADRGGLLGAGVGVRQRPGDRAGRLDPRRGDQRAGLPAGGGRGVRSRRRP